MLCVGLNGHPRILMLICANVVCAKAVTGLRAGSMGRSKAGTCGTALYPSHHRTPITEYGNRRNGAVAQSAKD
eukprot:scaffold3315_cov55-Cyclotella_meneghiniana.AAC.8